MHMVCSQCKFEFCWLCQVGGVEMGLFLALLRMAFIVSIPLKLQSLMAPQGDWKEHGERTGGFYACNKFESVRKTGEMDSESKRREYAKRSLERYM